MFIELTDHLRCPAPHEESFLVLLPDVIERRSVRRGLLGCPACNASYRIEEGVARFGGGAAPAVAAPVAPPPVEGVAAFLGLSGPGGYVALVGDVASLAGELATAVPGVHLVGVNAPAGTTEAERVSLLEAPALPIKARQLRGVVLGGGYGGDPAWVAEGVRVLLPGLRLAGAGPAPATGSVELLAEAGGWWVARKR